MKRTGAEDATSPYTCRVRGGAAFDEPIARETLPSSLTYGAVTITRDDL